MVLKGWEEKNPKSKGEVTGEMIKNVGSEWVWKLCILYFIMV